MATIEMRCPNCGGKMQLVNNQFTCQNCRTMMLNIVDAKIDADVTVMSPEEFARKIEESKRQFVVNINDNIKVFDVDTLVVNKRIQDATKALEVRKFDEVFSILNGIANTILSVERLRFLAEFNVVNEYELSFYDGYIDGNDHYSNIIGLADEQTKATYKKLADYCREQYDTKRRIESEIKEVEKLLSVKLYQEAIAYTKEMCRKYPQTALSWAYACEVKCNISSNYNCNLEFSMMEKCPDYSEANLPAALGCKIYNFANLANSYSGEYAEHTKYLGRVAGCMWGTILALALYGGSFLITNDFYNGIGPLMILLGVAIYVGALVLFIATIVNIVSAIKSNKAEKRLRKSYNAALNLIPNKIKETYRANCPKKKRKFFVLAIIAWLVIVALGIAIIIKKEVLL